MEAHSHMEFSTHFDFSPIGLHHGNSKNVPFAAIFNVNSFNGTGHRQPKQCFDLMLFFHKPK